MMAVNAGNSIRFFKIWSILRLSLSTNPVYPILSTVSIVIYPKSAVTSFSLLPVHTNTPIPAGSAPRANP